MRRSPRTKLSRRLQFEPLEDRRMLAMFTVDTNLDVVDENDGLLSLREAVAAANDNSEADEITFDFGHANPETILLTQGEIEILDSLTITGPGANLLTIDASGSDPTPEEDNGDGSRVFVVVDGLGGGGANSETGLILHGMTLTGGDTDFSGGAIRFITTSGNLTLQQVTLKDNFSMGIGGITLGFQINGGGGISFLTLLGSGLTLEQTEILGNRTLQFGGGLAAHGPVLNVSHSTIEGNQAGSAGGGIRLHGDLFSIHDSSISWNEAAGGGHAVHTFGSSGEIHRSNFIGNGLGLGLGSAISLSYVFAPVIIRDTLISGNGDTGIGVFFRTPDEDSSVSLVNTTIANNGGVGLAAEEIAGPGGGRVSLDSSTIVGNAVGFSVHGSAETSFSNSIIAGNGAEGGVPDDLNGFGLLTTANSFIGHSTTLTETGLTTPDANGNFIGGPIGGAIDPLLEDLKYNGGPTRTMRPMANSPVIDMGDPLFDPLDPDGDPATDDAILFDQRGAPFDRVVGGRIDMGAVEYNPALTPGDYNGDLMVDAADYTYWRATLGNTVTPLAAADGSGNGLVDELDYQVWRDHYGETYPPPPASLAPGEAGSPSGWLSLESRPAAVVDSPVPVESRASANMQAVDAALLLLAGDNAVAKRPVPSPASAVTATSWQPISVAPLTSLDRVFDTL